MDDKDDTVNRVGKKEKKVYGMGDTLGLVMLGSVRYK